MRLRARTARRGPPLTHTGGGDVTRKGRPWPLGIALREGALNALHGRWTSAIVALAAAWVLAVPAALDAAEVSRLVVAEARHIEAGAYAYAATGATVEGVRNPVPGVACDLLNGVTGVEAAFASSPLERAVEIASMPDYPITGYAVTAGALGFLSVSPSADGTGSVIVSVELAERTGLETGDFTVLREPRFARRGEDAPQAVRVVVADVGALGEIYRGSLLIVSAQIDWASTCFAKTTAQGFASLADYVASSLSYEGSPALPNTLLTSSEFTVDYSTAYQDRPLRFAWAGAAAVLGMLWLMIHWFRRSQRAIYATFDMPHHMRAAMTLSEWFCILIPAAVWAWGLGIAGALAFGARYEQALSLVTSNVALGALGATVIATLVAALPSGNLLADLKDR